MNPIVKSDRNISRPGGRLFIYDEYVYRLAQDDDPEYGIQVFAFKITELSEDLYTEEMIEKPLIKMTGKGWNAAGMHHLDLQKVGDKWLAVVDGRER
jgi:hypothetical protein